MVKSQAWDKTFVVFHIVSHRPTQSHFITCSRPPTCVSIQWIIPPRWNKTFA